MHHIKVYGVPLAVLTCGNIIRDITGYQGSVITMTYRHISMNALHVRPGEKRRTRITGQTGQVSADGPLKQVKWHLLEWDITLEIQELGEPRNRYKKVLIEM